MRMIKYPNSPVKRFALIVQLRSLMAFTFDMLQYLKGVFAPGDSALQI